MSLAQAATTPRRIVFCDATGYWAGAEAMLLDLAAHLDPARWQPLILLPFAGPFSQALTQAGLSWRSWPLATPHTRQDLRSPLALLRLGVRLLPSALRLAAQLRQMRAAILHTNSSAVLDGALAARLAGVPHVWHVRERVPLGAPLRTLWCRLILGLSAAVVVNSRAVRRQWDGRAGASRLHIIADGLDGEAFRPQASPAAVRAALGLERDVPVIGMTGRIAPIKGQAIFLQAAAQLSAAFPQARFLLVGGALPAYEPLRQALLAQANQPPLTGRVVFTGEVARAAMPDLLQVCDVLAAPTTTMEGFGLAVLEGMALARPVVATLGGPEDLIVDGETGFLIPPGDAPALTAALTRLLANPDQARRMGVAGQQRAQAQFSLAQHVQRLQTLYAALTDSR